MDLSPVSPKGFRVFRPVCSVAECDTSRRGRLRLVEPTPASAREAEAAETDSLLCSLSGREARCRRALGRLAGAFGQISGHHRLGFARLGDYSRERLGLSGREMQSLASVSVRLEKLPSIAAAFDRGELSWSKVRLLAAVARPGPEEEIWLGRARGKTVRALVREIGQARGELRPADPVLLRNALDEETGSVDGEEASRLRIACPARILSLWRRAVELARRMLGEQAVLWKAAEAIAAEGASAAPATNASALPADARATFDTRGSLPLSRPASVRSLARETVPKVLWTDATAEARPEEARLADLSRSLEGLDAFDLDERMREVVSSLRKIDAEMGRLLRKLLDSRSYRALGFESFDDYVTERLWISSSRARTLILLERRAEEIPELARAYRSGELSWVRVLAILPVVAGPFAARWIARAGEVTVRRLSDEVEWALARCEQSGDRAAAPPEADAPLATADLQMCAHAEGEVADREVTFLGPVSVVDLLRTTVAAFRAGGEPAWKGLERLLLHVTAEWEGQPRHRDPVFERDGWRCAVPACSSRRNLHDHHMRFRSRGGGNERENRSAHCVWHHLRGIHGGLVCASGPAPEAIVWQLGIRAGREALLVLRGDRYLRGL